MKNVQAEKLSNETTCELCGKKYLVKYRKRESQYTATIRKFSCVNCAATLLVVYRNGRVVLDNLYRENDKEEIYIPADRLYHPANNEGNVKDTRVSLHEDIDVLREGVAQEKKRNEEYVPIREEPVEPGVHQARDYIERKPRRSNPVGLISLFVVFIAALILWSQFTLFVIQPIGAVPKGRTLLILRLNKTEFIDSADAMCRREMNKVSLICRITMMGAVIEKSTIVGRFPYSSMLYSISTGGRSYEK